MASQQKIAVVGLWHCGEIYSAGLVELGHDVVGIDENTETIANLQKGIPPLEEPELVPLIQKNIAAGRLRFSNDFSEVANTPIVWFSYDTPVDDEDVADTAPIFAALEKVIPFLQNNATVIFSSQLPVGTMQKIKELVAAKRPELQFGIAYVPENLQLGKAVRSFFEPGRIVIGAENEKTFALIENIFSSLKTQFLRMSPASAEMAKHGLNAFLATSLTFIYDIADLCEKVGADVTDVSRALKSDPRIGQGAYIDASVGFSGGTLGRDLRAMINEAKHKNVALPIISTVYAKNADRRKIFVERIKEILGGLAGKTIGLLGVTYKVGTSTLRRSMALEIAVLLQKEGAQIRASDPMAKKEEVAKSIRHWRIDRPIALKARSRETRSGIQFFADPYEMAEGCNAIILMTAWPEYKEIDVIKMAEVTNPVKNDISNGAREPKVFFDTRNFLKDKEEEFKKARIKYVGIGRGIEN